jgi:hypothetical protein
VCRIDHQGKTIGRHDGGADDGPIVEKAVKGAEAAAEK